MAKSFASPKEIVAPVCDIRTDYRVHSKNEDNYVEEIKAWCKKTSACPDAGSEIKFPIADGYARYAVYDYSTLIHLDVGDSRSIPDAHVRGLRVVDVKREIALAEAGDDLWAKFGNE